MNAQLKNVGDGVVGTFVIAIAVGCGVAVVVVMAIVAKCGVC